MTVNHSIQAPSGALVMEKNGDKFMSQEVAVMAAPVQVPLQIRDKIDTIKQTVAKDATDAQLEMFLTLAERYQLDPFLKEIWFNREIGSITGRDGYLKIAQRDPEFDGIVSAAVCEGDTFGMKPMIPDVQHEFGAKRGAVIGAYAVVFHKRRRPVVCYAPIAEYQKSSAIWQKYRSAMICKVAEVLALKRQFGISGLVTEEEVGSSADMAAPNPPIPPAYVRREEHAREQEPSVPDVPDPVQDLYRQLTAADTKAKVFYYFQQEFVALLGETRGVETYNTILGQHGVDGWQQFKTLGKAKQCVLALWNKLQELQTPAEEAGELFEGQAVS